MAWAEKVCQILIAIWLIGTISISRAHPPEPEEPPEPPATPAVQKLLADATTHVQAKRYTDALAAAEQALVVAQKERDGPGEAQAQRQHAQALQALNRSEDAAATWRAAAAAWERVGDGPGRIEALATAGLLIEAQQPEEAAALRNEALALGRVEARRPLAAAQALHAAGQSYYARRRLGPAREFWTVTLALREWQAPNSPDVAESLNSLGAVVRQQGNLAVAKEYHQRALAISEQEAPGSLDMAKSLNNLGTVAAQQGDLAAAKDYFHRALAIQEQQAPNSLAVAGSLNNLGNVAWQQGDLAAAKEYHQRALAINEKLAPNSLAMAASLGNVGLVAEWQGDLAAARDYFQRALAINEQQAPDSLDVAASLNNLGSVAGRQGDLAAAKDYQQRALVIRERHAPSSLDVAKSLNHLGLVAWQQGDLVAAKDYHQRALAIQEWQAPTSLDTAKSLFQLGRIAKRSGDLVGAESRWQHAWTRMRGQSLAVRGDEARQAFGESTVEYVVDMIGAQVALGKRGEAFRTLEESRAQALLPLLLERQAVVGTTAGERWKDYQIAVVARDRAELTLSRTGVIKVQAQAKLAEQQKKSAEPESIARAQADLQAATEKFQEAQSYYTRARTEADQHWATILQSAPRAFPTPLTLEQAAEVLPTGTLYLAFAVGEEASYLFLLHTDDDGRPVLETYPLPKARALAAHVQTFREQMMRRIDLHGVVQAGRALYRTLFPAAARWIVARAPRLLISPDGPLWDVPFAALVTSAPGRKVRYLGGEKPITYTPSLTIFAQARREAPSLPKGQPPAALVVGDPVFERGPTALTAAQPARERLRGERYYLWQGGSPPGRLPATRREAEQVARFYATAPLLDEQATEAAVREQMQRADVIHLATHGWLSRTRAMDSGLLLTAPEKEPDPGEYANDGFLQAWEIHNQLKLRAELVVLSGCETARGQVVRGEGLVGLVRALQYAGARSVVASQWKVLDEQTAKLMVRFHQELRQGVAKDEALRRAMRYVRERLGLRHPYHWAGFLLMGDPDNPNLGVRP